MWKIEISPASFQPSEVKMPYLTAGQLSSWMSQLLQRQKLQIRNDKYLIQGNS